MAMMGNDKVGIAEIATGFRYDLALEPSRRFEALPSHLHQGGVELGDATFTLLPAVYFGPRASSLWDEVHFLLLGWKCPCDDVDPMRPRESLGCGRPSRFDVATDSCQ